MLDDCEKLGITDLCYVYRDGYLTEKVHKILEKYYNPVNIRKIYITRSIVITFLSTEKNGLSESLREYPAGEGMTLDLFIRERLFVSEDDADYEEIKNLFAEHGLSLSSRIVREDYESLAPVLQPYFSKHGEKYAEESSHIKVETKDPVVNPKFTSQYTSDDVSANSLIVVCGDRSKVVSYDTIYQSSMDYNTYSYTTTGFDGEGQIDSAISYVTSENLPILYTLDGHGEKELDSTLKEDIEKANIDIQSLNLLTEESVPDDAACLLINAPTSDISDTEKDAIIEYLENGGKAMIFSDYTEESMTNFDAVLANYGVERTEGIVIEGDSQHYAQMPYYLVPTVDSTDAISNFASNGYYVLMPYAQGIQKTDDVRDTVTINSLLTTSDSAYSKVDVNSGNIEETDDDIKGPFDLGVSITESLDDDKETQIVYYSSSNLMDSQINQMVSGGNEQMLMESLSWMCSSDETSTISVPAKDLQVSYLTLTAYDASFWKIIIIGLIPVAFLVIGFGVWMKRRKA